MFLSGGDGNGGAGIAVSGRLMAAIIRVLFHASSDRVCLLKFSYAGFYFHFLSCHFPPSWAKDIAAEGVYSTLDIIPNKLRTYPGPIVFGGDFNACVGGLQPSDDMTLVGRWGRGTTECSREDVGQLGFGKRIPNFVPAVRHGGRC